ncbi:MAG: hypothetical protein DDT34_01957 [Firmicutes bacterium]|nr:hypothetical protein [Bacillota bacterium]
MIQAKFVKVVETDGFYHSPEWYRPLAFGKNIYMNVAYLLPGVEMVMGSKREKEAELLERVVYVLTGHLDVRQGDEAVSVGPHTAFIVPLEPGLPFYVKNTGESIASFITTMSPPPHPELKFDSPEQVKKLYLEAKRPVKSPTEMNELVGGI